MQAGRDGEESDASIPPTPLEGEEERSAVERHYVSETEASDSGSRRPASLRGSQSPSRVLVPASPVEERGTTASASPVYEGDDEGGSEIPLTQPSFSTPGSQRSASRGSPGPSLRRNSPFVDRDYSVSPDLIPAAARRGSSPAFMSSREAGALEPLPEGYGE